MKNYKSYPKYKNSGIPWLGEIPEHWEEMRAKAIGEFNGSTVDKKINEGETLVRIVNFTDVFNNKSLEVHNKKFMKVSAKPSQIVSFNLKIGDVLFTPSSEDRFDIGRSNVVKYSNIDLLYSYHLIRLRFVKDIDIDFKKYLFNNKFIFHYFSSECTGTTRQILVRDKFKNIPVILPSLPEQTAIANFLDYKLSKTNRFIRKKKQLIKLLNEQKDAIINQAVTKGLDPNFKMKESGVEWLGEIPEHWEVRKLKYVAEIYPSNIDKHSREGEKTVRLCNYTDVYKNDYITNDMNLMVATASDEQIARFTLLPNDVIITKDSETANDIAVPAVVKEELDNVVCGYHLSVMRPNEKVLGEFLFRILQSKVINIQFEVNANGVTRVGLGTYFQRNPKIPLPPIDEQQKIIKFILKEIQTITTTISKIKKEISLVEEFKTALIAEAVTGKIDVRDFVVPDFADNYLEEEENDIDLENVEEYETIEE